MRGDRASALKLRLQGRSYSEIQKELGVPKSTLSGWLATVVIADRFRERINSRAREKSREGLIKRNVNQTRIAQDRAHLNRQEAGKEIDRLSSRDILILASALYWAEGYKRPIIRNGLERTYHTVSLTNTDPMLVRAFLRFLREWCKVPESKIKANLRIFEHQSERSVKEYWLKETGICSENFGKTYRGISISSQGKRPYNRLEYGIIQIVVADTTLYHKIMGYIERIKQLI